MTTITDESTLPQGGGLQVLSKAQQEIMNFIEDGSKGEDPLFLHLQEMMGFRIWGHEQEFRSDNSKDKEELFSLWHLSKLCAKRYVERVNELVSVTK